MSSLITERRVISVIILLLTVGLVVSTFGLQFADLGGAFSPMFFPRIILIILMGLAVLNVVDVISTPSKTPIQLGPVLMIAAAFVAYVLVLVPLGYFISSVGVGIVILLALGVRNPLQIIAIPVVGAGSLVLLFNHVLKMPLPVSPFVWWL
jgi:hypothetical protein